MLTSHAQECRCTSPHLASAETGFHTLSQTSPAWSSLCIQAALKLPASLFRVLFLREQIAEATVTQMTSYYTYLLLNNLYLYIYPSSLNPTSANSGTLHTFFTSTYTHDTCTHDQDEACECCLVDMLSSSQHHFLGHRVE